MDGERASSGIQQSVLDRLLDGGRAGSEAEIRWDASIEHLKQSLRRDLEWLLNTRRTIVPLPDGVEELPSSAFYFGIPDLTSMNKDHPETQVRLLRLVEEAVNRFEPRLSNVRVTLQAEKSMAQRELHFLIEGLLRRDPMPEEVAFDTVLRIVTGEIEVPGEHHDG